MPVVPVSLKALSHRSEGAFVVSEVGSLAVAVTTGRQLLADYEAAPAVGIEVSVDDGWRRVAQVCTDLNDEAEPIFVDFINRGGRLVVGPDDEVTVRTV